MKIVINTSYGGFTLPKEIAHKLGCDIYNQSTETRTSTTLIKYVEKDPWKALPLAVVNIPDNATDFFIFDYDGAERLVAAIDGKIIPIWPKDMDF